MDYVWVLFAVLALLSSTAGAQGFLDNNYWVIPPDPGANHVYAHDIVWRWGSDQAVQWHSMWPIVNIKIYQNNNPNFWILTPNNFLGEGYQTLPYNAIFPGYFLDRRLPLIFFLRIDNVNNDSQAFSSHYYNLVDAPSSITAATLSQNTTPPSSPLASAPTVAPTSTPTIAPTSTPDRTPTSTRTSTRTSTPTIALTSDQTVAPTVVHSGSLSIGAEAGISAGAAVVLLAVICSLGGLVYYRRKAKAARFDTAAYGQSQMEHRAVYVPTAKGAFDRAEDIDRAKYSQNFYTPAFGAVEVASNYPKSPRELPS